VKEGSTAVVVVHIDGDETMYLNCGHIIYEYGEPCQNDIDRKIKDLGEKPVPVSLCPP
jgi:hypothetical protein